MIGFFYWCHSFHLIWICPIHQTILRRHAWSSFLIVGMHSTVIQAFCTYKLLLLLLFSHWNVNKLFRPFASIGIDWSIIDFRIESSATNLLLRWRHVHLATKSQGSTSSLSLTGSSLHFLAAREVRLVDGMLLLVTFWGALVGETMLV